MTASRRSWLSVRHVISVVLLVLATVLIWWLWPARLGGPTTIVIVEGHSMEPTYHSGDLIIARRQHHYDTSDVIVFRATIPGRTQPALVIHRLLQVGSDGRITTQGDNRTNPDSFQLTTDDIVGRAELDVPNGGTILWFLSRWWILAAVTGLVVTLTLWPSRTPLPDGLQEAKWTPPNPLAPTT